MLKTVFAATAAITIAGSSLAYAQPREGRPDGGRRWQPSMEDAQAYQAARLAALHAGLMLNADQERHWPAFEQAMREMQKLRLDRAMKMREAFRQRREAGDRRDTREGRDSREGRDGRGGRDTREGRGTPEVRKERDQRPAFGNPAERMRQRAARLSDNGAVLKRLADALEPLYNSLNDAQKRRFAALSRVGGPRGGWQRGRRDGGDRGTWRGQRRSDWSAPEQRGQRQSNSSGSDAMPQPERLSNSKIIDGTVSEGSAGRTFGAKLRIEEAVFFASKAIAGEPAVFVGKAMSFGGKVITGEGLGTEGVGFSRKINIVTPSSSNRTMSI